MRLEQHRRWQKANRDKVNAANKKYRRRQKLLLTDSYIRHQARCKNVELTDRNLAQIKRSIAVKRSRKALQLSAIARVIGQTKLRD